MDRQNPKDAGKVAGPDFLALAARVAIGLVFIVSGTFKASSPPEEFALIISYYNLSFISPDLAQTIAVFLPWIELLLGYSLVLGYFTREAAVGAAALLACFSGALLSIKARGIELPNCGCFGVKGFHPSPTVTLCMDLVLLAAAYVAFSRGSCRPSLDNWADGGYT